MRLLLPIAIAIVLVLLPAAQASAPTPFGEAPDARHSDERLRVVLAFDHEPTYQLHQQVRRVLLTFDALSREQVQASLGSAEWKDHPLIQRAGVVQPSGQPTALALELTAATSASSRIYSRNGRHVLVLEVRRETSPDPAIANEEPASGLQPAPPVDHTPALVTVRLGRRDSGTRLVIETAQALAFNMRSSMPSQNLIMELHGMDADTLASALAAQLPPDHELIESLNVSGGQTALSRLQIGLHRHVQATVFNLNPDNGHAHRLVIDLVPEPSRRTPTKAVAGAFRKPDRPEALAPAADVDAEELLWLDTRVNLQRRRHTVLARRVDDKLYLTAEDLSIWALQLPLEAVEVIDGESWYELERLGIDYSLDARRLTLDMSAPAGLFAGHAMDASERKRLAPTPSPPGAFFNYDLSAMHASRTSASGLFELGAFNGWGTFTTSGIFRHGSDVRDQGLVRLDTSHRRDWPERMRTLVLGDTLSRGTAWSGGVRFAGIQWGNNFDLQPELITLPLLSMGGEAALPSTVEVYINDVLRLRESIAPGPFDIDQIPVVTGAGQATIVVTDILGRQQLITQDFYASQRLLRAGLHDFNWEVGAVRENYGIDDFDYGRGFVAATHRYGFSNRLTGEFHAQHTGDHTTAGTGATLLLPYGGVLDTAAAVSNSDAGNGNFASVGLQRQGQRFSAGISGQVADAAFTRLGLVEGRSLPARQLRAHGSMRAFGNGTLSLSYTEQRRRDHKDIEFLTLRFSQRVARIGTLSLSAAHYLDTGDNAVTATLTMALDQPRTSATTSASWRDNHSYATAGIRRNLPVGTGFGYDLQARVGDGSFQRGSLAWQNDYGTWQAEASHRGGRTAGRGQAAGGLAWLGGQMFAARSIRDSFGVVQVPGFEGVRVYAENQEIGRTNSRGNALVPHMRPYQRNRLRIEQADLPLGVRIDGLDAEIAPYWRSGVIVAFPVWRSRDAFFRILLESGEPLPLGAAIFDEHGAVWPVGHRGETFITGLDEHNRFDVRHNGRRCEFEIAVPETDHPLPDLGTVTCREAQ